MTLPTRDQRLADLRAAITAANYRAITPDCCGRPMEEHSRECSDDAGDSFEFVCPACSRRSFVDLPCRLAHAHRVLSGAL